jgi:thiamine biosynthesis lipoprotein
MGTWVDTVYSTPDARTLERVGAELDELLGRYEIDYYAWADGELGRLNAALSSGNDFTASRELVDLLARARELTRSSDGFFDPGVGTLVEAWGFNSAESEPREPDAAFLDAWSRGHPSITDLHIDGRRLSADTTGLLIDLGGIAKGEIIDRILEQFGAAGVNDVLVNAGGDVRVRGMRGERSWTIGIQSPRAAELLGSIALDDGEAAFTSGDYERFFETDDGRRHHLIDPVTGRPAEHTQAVTVIADNGALADAAATALFVAGPANWRRIAAALGIVYVLRVDASGSIEMTPAMRERVRMQGTEEPATINDESNLARL